MAQGLYVAYADFNCPFCFALSERLAGLDVASEVDWRPIQHLPDAPEPAQPLQAGDLDELREEIERLGTVEPEIRVRNQRLRPSSRLATRALAAIRGSHPELAWGFIRGIYRALWREGRDISDAEVVREVADDCGVELPADFADDQALQDEIDAAQKEWEEGDFDRRLPVMQSPQGATLMGLGSAERTRLFIESGRFSTRYDDEVCVDPSTRH